MKIINSKLHFTIAGLHPGAVVGAHRLQTAVAREGCADETVCRAHTGLDVCDTKAGDKPDRRFHGVS